MKDVIVQKALPGEVLHSPFRDLVSTFVSRVWVGLLNLVCVPFYARIMSVESYGLIGFYMTLQILLVTVDAGLSTTINRDLARYSASGADPGRMRDAVHTLGRIYWLLAGSIGVLVAVAAPVIAGHWLRFHGLPASTVRTSIVLMGAAMALQFPCTFYLSGLMGLDKQVLSNILQAAAATLRNGPVVFVIYFISPSVATFFTWQVIANAGMLIPCAMVLWRSLPTSSLRPRFSMSILLECRGFVGYMGAISATSIVFSQLDRIILSRFVTLEQLGFYTIAWTLAGSIYMLQSPVYASIFPKVTRLMTIGDMHNLTRLYHTGCQLISVLTIPLAMLAVFFPFSLLTIWTRNSQIAANARQVLVVLSLSAILSSAAQLPFALQQARGWVKATLLTNLIGLLITIPLAVFAVVRFGMLGGASVFLIIKGLCSIAQCEITHARVLHHARRTWYLSDVGLPLMVSVMVVGAFSLLWSDRTFSAALTPFRMLTIYAATVGAVTFSTPQIRKQAIKLLTPRPLSCPSRVLSLCTTSKRGK